MKILATSERICKRPGCHAEGRTQPIENFYVDKSRKDGYHPYCKECQKAVTKHYQETRPEDFRAKCKRATIKYVYGLTEVEYEALLERANGGCEICRKTEFRLVIDHDHDTGKVRGILCDNCNQGLGRFFEDPLLMQAAITYLRTHHA